MGNYFDLLYEMKDEPFPDFAKSPQSAAKRNAHIKSSLRFGTFLCSVGFAPDLGYFGEQRPPFVCFCKMNVTYMCDFKERHTFGDFKENHLLTVLVLQQ